MKNRQPSLDGFVPRRPGVRRQIGDTPALSAGESAQRPRIMAHASEASSVGVPEQQINIKNQISESLQSIDEPQEPTGRGKKRRGKDKKPRKPWSKRRRIITWVVSILVGLALAAGLYVGIKALLAGSKVFKGDLFGLIQNQPLKEDANGRSNFVIFGTAEDSEGGMHGGANLTDSIMVVSIDQDKKDAFMISLPRDLWVQYREICTVGNQGKLNAVYFCASDDGKNEQAGANALRQKTGEILGMDIQYFVHLNFTAVTEAVDAVGGIDVTIESDDPRGILDRNFDWKCNYSCYYVNYKNGQKVHLDGEHALALARARNAAGGYGLPNGNFDREKNQQKIIKALREKAVSAGTLANIGKVTGLIDALGNNLRTNIETKEIRTLMTLGSEIQSSNIRSLSLVDEDEMLVTTGSYNGQSIVRPIPGLLDYSQIKSYIKKHISADPVVREGAPIVVLNGTNSSGVAQRHADKLQQAGYTISVVDNAPTGNYDDVEVYQIGTSYPKTAEKLKQRYKLESLKTSTPPIAVVEGTGFVIIVGNDPDAVLTQ